MNTTIDCAAAASVIRDGFGITINGQNLAPALGYMVSVYPEREERYPVEAVTADVIEGYVARHADLIDSPVNFLGAWVTDGVVYLDVSVNEIDRGRAVALGREHDQLAIYDVVARRDIRL